MKNTNCIYADDAGKNKNKCFVSARVVRSVDDTLKKYNMIDGIHGIVVAFSGGADSTALLDILAELFVRRGMLRICAFHVNHGIRGRDADMDEEHCKKFCADRNIPFASVHIDVPAEARLNGTGIEETARRMRYDELVSYCVKHGYDCIATAHHADDNLETLIFRITRGTGVRGLCGIPPVRNEQGIRVIRPLIRLCRNEIEDYLSERDLSYVTDCTNSDVNYSRNRIRELIIPELRKINPLVHISATRLTEQANDVFTFITESEKSEHDIRGCEDQNRIFALFEKYRDFAEINLGRAPMLENVHAVALNKLIKNGKLWSSVSLPGSISAVRTRDGIEFQLKKEEFSDADKFKTDVECTGSVRKIPLHTGWNFFETMGVGCSRKVSLILVGNNVSNDIVKKNKANVFSCFEDDVFLNGEAFYNEKDEICLLRDDILAKIKKGIINIYKLSIYAEVNSVKLSGSVFVRYRLDGDRIKHNNMTKRVKKILQEKDVSPNDRDTLPFVCDDEGIIWIPGVVLRDGVRAKICDENTLYFYYIDCE